MLRRRRRIRPVAIDPATGDVISPWPFVGLILMACSFFLYAASGLLVPWWTWLLLVVVWLVLLPSTLTDWGRRPRRPFAVGLASLGVWAVVVLAGGLVFAWDPWWGPVDWFG